MSTPIPLSRLAEEFDIVEAEDPIPISEVADHEEVTDGTLKNKTLPPLVWFYIIANTVLALAVFGFATLELFYKPTAPVVDDKVVIALISGNTIQLAAIIVAAFRGLFAAPTET